MLNVPTSHQGCRKPSKMGTLRDSGAASISTTEQLYKLNRGISYKNCENWGHVAPDSFKHASHYACLGGYYHQIMQ